jgi:PAS domain S-box-containing protein
MNSLEEIKDINNSLLKIRNRQSDLLDRFAKSQFISTHSVKNKEVLRALQNVSDTDNLARLTWDNEFRIVYANKVFLKTLGYELSDIIGKKIIERNGTSEFISKETLDDSLETITKNMENGIIMIQGVNNEWYAKDGSKVPIRWLVGFNDTYHGYGSTQCIFVAK